MSYSRVRLVAPAALRPFAEYRSVDVVLELGEEPRLGQYRIAIRSQEGRNRWWGNANFRVEEYKRPTFEATMLDPEEPLRLNKPAEMKGEAKDYFGLPVTNGHAK